jgi:hypothetical protein
MLQLLQDKCSYCIILGYLAKLECFAREVYFASFKFACGKPELHVIETMTGRN